MPTTKTLVSLMILLMVTSAWPAFAQTRSGDPISRMETVCFVISPEDDVNPEHEPILVHTTIHTVFRYTPDGTGLFQINFSGECDNMGLLSGTKYCTIILNSATHVDLSSGVATITYPIPVIASQGPAPNLAGSVDITIDAAGAMLAMDFHLHEV